MSSRIKKSSTAKKLNGNKSGTGINVRINSKDIKKIKGVYLLCVQEDRWKIDNVRKPWRFKKMLIKFLEM